MFLKFFNKKMWLIRLSILTLAFIVFVGTGFAKPIPILIGYFVLCLFFVYWDISDYKTMDCPNAKQSNPFEVIKCRLGDICAHQYRSSCCSKVNFTNNYLKCTGRNKKPKFVLFKLFKKISKKIKRSWFVDTKIF